MIRIEPDANGQVLFTNEQFATATRIIALEPDLHYDLTEERFKQDSVTWARLMLWRWPATRQGIPTRTWIEPDGNISMDEDVDWITDEEWPAWAGTPDTQKDTPS
ncbi:hypothetical protein SEA_BRUHMOMENT_95 [Arthrobacter phage BruhMoment]|nr:hypothetical protein SEA_BRUHMOMENT_95 [Arthrobacter phage BruhMoment]